MNTIINTNEKYSLIVKGFYSALATWDSDTNNYFEEEFQKEILLKFIESNTANLDPATKQCEVL